MTVTAYQKADLTSASVAHYEDGARLTIQAQNRSWAKIYDGAADLTGYMLLEDLEPDLIEEEILEDEVIPFSPVGSSCSRRMLKARRSPLRRRTVTERSPPASHSRS